MKIFLVITRLDRGGSSDAVLNLATGLINRGCEVTVVYGKTSHPATDLSDFRKTNRVDLTNVPELQRDINPFKDVIALIKLLGLMQRERPDVVHTHSSKAGILGRIAAWLAGVDAILHSPHGHIFYGYYAGAKTRLFIWLEKLTAAITDRITTLTESGKKDHIELGIANAKKFVVIPCGIDLKKFDH